MIQLCFHGIGPPGRAVPVQDEPYFVSRDLFLATLDLVAPLMAGHGPGPADGPGVQLSFDDGYASDVTIALPELASRGLTARFFPVAGHLGRPGYLSAAGSGELAATAMTVGSHGMWHRSWRRLEPGQQREELIEAREVLRAATGQPVDSAACPLGIYDRRLLGRLRELGYTAVFTSDRRPARSGAWLQPRYSVRGTDTVQTVRDGILGRPRLPQRARAAAASRVKAWR